MMIRKNRSYTFNSEKDVLDSGITNPAFILGEPELKQLAIEKPHGGRMRFYSRTVGWDIDDHRISLEAVIDRYETSLEGLDHITVERNRTKYGPNVLFPPKKSSELVRFCQCCLTGLNLLFWICGILSLVCFFGQYVYTDDIDTDNLWSGVSLLVIVLVAGCFTYYQEFKSSQIMESFKTMMPTNAVVWRGGQRQDVNVEDIVTGDIVEMRAGDRVPADIRLFECSSLKVDNSTLTGESDPQKRTIFCTHHSPLESSNLVFFSTNVVEGSGKGVVIYVGQRTFMGRIASLASSMDSVKTPIAREMERIIRVMTLGSLAFGIVFFAVGLYIRYTLLQAVFFAIGIIIANVPESLNVTLTIILALTAQRMAVKNCLVKHLHAVETLGSASVICSDKTGTLTQNKMSVAHFWFNRDIAQADVFEFAGKEGRFEKNNPGFSALATVAMLCSKANFLPGQTHMPVNVRIVDGDSSEAAILRYMELHLGCVEAVRAGYPKVFEIPFNSRNKFQVSVHEDPKDPSYLLVMKGAPERIVSMCSTILVNNVEHEMNDTWRTEIDRAYAKLGGLGERALGFCDCRLSTSKYPKGNYEFDPDSPQFLKEGFRFVGLISMIDPPRPAVPEAVRKCREAGIRVTMVTGDHPVTATAIARAVGIFSPGSKTVEDIAAEKGVDVCELDSNVATAQVIMGTKLEMMEPEDLDELLLNYEEMVFARTTPEQKYMIVSAFQRIGHVVAVTGDGVNDAPALKKADIGIAMGVTGTDVAKEVADMILLDDNFASIVTGVEDGRLIFDNLRKLFRFVMADNVSQMYCYWIFILFKIPLPVATIPMLLSTSGTDIFPAISLAYESPEADIMKLKPRDQEKDTLITKANLSYAYGQVSVIQTCAAFFVYFVIFGCSGWLPDKLIFVQDKWDSQAIQDLTDSYGQEWTYTARCHVTQAAQTGFFMALVAMQLVNALACKTRRLSLFRKKMKNRVMNIALITSPLMAAVFIYTPYLNDAVSLTPLVSPEPFIALIPFLLLLFFYDEARRWVLRGFPYTWILEEFSV